LTIIALAQSAGISQAYTNPDGKYPTLARLYGQGAGNLAGALVQGLPAGGSLGVRRCWLRRGKIALGQHFTGVFAAILILVFGAAIGQLAIAALAGLLMVVGFQTIKFARSG